MKLAERNHEHTYWTGIVEGHIFLCVYSSWSNFKKKCPALHPVFDRGMSGLYSRSLLLLLLMMVMMDE